MLQRRRLLVSTSRSTVKETVLVLFAIGLGMKVRGFHWLAYLASIQLRRPVIGGERSDKSRPNVYKLSIELHQ